MSSTLQKTKKRKPKRKPTREDDIPQDSKFGPFARFLFSQELCRDFISSVALYKPEENQDEKKKEKKEEKKEKKPVNKQVNKYLKQKNPIIFFTQQHQFTELEVMTLWNSFKIDFPEDKINKIQLNELVAQLFPK